LEFRLKILGANSATPAYGRHQTSQLLNLENHYFLIDCGEGTQMQLIKYRAKISRIRQIFISHLHGDHIFGLIGLINTMNLNGRTEDLHVYGPHNLQDIITVMLRHSHTSLRFRLHFTAVDSEHSYLLYHNDRLNVYTIPMDHGIACSGFLFVEKEKERRINKETLPDDISVEEILDLKRGKDIYYADGSLRYANDKLTLPPRKSRSYAYCADTRYNEHILDIIRGVDLLYHEATFMHDQAEKAWERYHSTTIEAATLAMKAEAGSLIIGHYSSRYRELQPLLQEAQTVFPETQLAEEGKDYYIEES
jgi:ribonuclease Z